MGSIPVLKPGEVESLLFRDGFVLAHRGESASVARTRMLAQMPNCRVGAATQLYPQDTASRGYAAATQYWGLTASFVARMTFATGC